MRWRQFHILKSLKRRKQNNPTNALTSYRPLHRRFDKILAAYAIIHREPLEHPFYQALSKEKLLLFYLGSQISSRNYSVLSACVLMVLRGVWRVSLLDAS